MANDNKELKRSSESLYKNIDACISDIVKARLQKDDEAEGRALFMMETLMVATLQQLSCIIVHLGEEEKKSVDLVAELKHHLETTPKEQLEKEWKELEPWGNVGPTVKEFLYGKQMAEKSDAESDYGIDEDYIPATLLHALKKHGWYACHCKERPAIIDARRAYVMRNWNVGNENLPQDHKPIEDNEDERIRKFIIECIDELRKADAENAEFNGECGEAIAYLEKQKEQKPLSSEETELNSIAFLEQIGYTCIPPGKEQKPEIKYVYPIFRVGDTIKPKVYNESHRINKIKDDNYVLDNGFTFPIVDQDVWEIVDQKPVEWSEEDQTIIDCAVEIVEKAELPSLAASLKSLRPQPKQKWTIKDAKPGDILTTEGGTTTFIFKRVDGGFVYMYCSYAFSTTGRDLNLSDTNVLSSEYVRPASIEQRRAFLEELVKHLSSQPYWKPSEEQKDAVNHACNIMVGDRYHTAICSLFEELQKLD